jgi:hypothetical protein
MIATIAYQGDTLPIIPGRWSSSLAFKLEVSNDIIENN